jgi:diadenosine tetraphosphatase ApaH/serine/threonine PP2A family protein phosphatase
MVGYGADPVACVESVAARASAIVAGNHEHGALGRLNLEWFNPVAREAAMWTGDALGPDHRRYLDALAVRAQIGEATLVHASPRDPEEWDYLVDADDGFEVFGDFDTRVCFVGHTHRPGVWSLGSSGPEWDPSAGGPGGTTALLPGRRYIVNIGSVGQPRDRDARAAYAVWDQEARTVTIRRVGYEVREAARKIIAAGLPRALADRLAHGL